MGKFYRLLAEKIANNIGTTGNSYAGAVFEADVEKLLVADDTDDKICDELWVYFKFYISSKFTSVHKYLDKFFTFETISDEVLCDAFTNIIAAANNTDLVLYEREYRQNKIRAFICENKDLITEKPNLSTLLILNGYDELILDEETRIEKEKLRQFLAYSDGYPVRLTRGNIKYLDTYSDRFETSSQSMRFYRNTDWLKANYISYLMFCFDRYDLSNFDLDSGTLRLLKKDLLSGVFSKEDCLKFIDYGAEYSIDVEHKIISAKIAGSSKDSSYYANRQFAYSYLRFARMLFILFSGINPNNNCSGLSWADQAINSIHKNLSKLKQSRLFYITDSNNADANNFITANKDFFKNYRNNPKLSDYIHAEFKSYSWQAPILGDCIFSASNGQFKSEYSYLMNDIATYKMK